MLEIVQAFGVLAALLISYLSLRNLPARVKRRSTLKSDIEVYNLLDKSDPKRAVVKASIDRSLDRLYGARAPSGNWKSWDWGAVIVWALMAVGFGYWTFYLVKDEFRWWAILTGFVALVGLFGVATWLTDSEVRRGEDVVGETKGEGPTST
jgi:hypothetical protein